MSISIHALLAESDPAEHPWWPGREFLSTLSLRRATLKGCRCTTIRTYFYPRSPCGERPGCPHRAHSPHRYFYPRSPCGERPLCISVLIMPHFISIHALLAESDGLAHCATVSAVQISIHALLAESDVSGLGRAARIISIHALLAESDQEYIIRNVEALIFLSTLSLRRATTRQTYHKDESQEFLSTLSLRRATVHALKFANPMLFLSTLSLRRATLDNIEITQAKRISIHALLAESDAPPLI